MSADARVSFLIAGVQKGGTTALFRYLEALGPVAMAPVKETHFFDDEKSVDWAAPDYAAYHAQFPAFDGRPRGEATPIYIYWPHSLARIARYNPAMKLILLFRDPVERAWSQWNLVAVEDGICPRVGARALRLVHPRGPRPGRLPRGAGLPSHLQLCGARLLRRPARSAVRDLSARAGHADRLGAAGGRAERRPGRDLRFRGRRAPRAGS